MPLGISPGFALKFGEIHTRSGTRVCFWRYACRRDGLQFSLLCSLAIMKILNLVLAALFILFAFVQVNDPDPVVWILIYGLMAVVCILAAFRYYYPVALVVLLVAFAAYSFVSVSGVMEWLQSDDKSMLFDDLAKMQYPYIEESREFLGLLICMVVLIMHLITYRTLRKAYR